MARELFHIEGGKELDDALKAIAEDFHPRNARNVLVGALKDGGQVIANAGQSFAPRLTGKLAISYTTSTKLTRRQKSQRRKLSQIERFVGPTPHAKSVQTEFGNAHQAAHPHLRPAFDGNVQKVLRLIISAASERLETMRAKLARKAEREAARLRAGK